MTRRVTILGMLLGCATTHPTALRAPTRPQPAVAASPRPAQVYIGRGTAGRARAPDGLAGVDGSRYLADTTRLLVAGEVVRVADDLTPTAIADAVEVDGQWVFADYGGAILASDGFVGALHAVGRVPVGARVNPWSRGRVPLTAAGRLWITDGRTLAEARLPRSGAVEAAFADARRGALVLRDGALFQTVDGGATWRDGALDGELAFGVSFDGEALRVATSAGSRTLADDGTLSVANHAVRDARREVPSAVRDALAARDESALLTLPGGARVELTEGVLTWTPRDGARQRLRAADGGCDTLAPWGDGFGVLCDRWLRGTGDGHVFLVAFPGEDAPRDALPVLSDDGVHAALAGRCPDARDADDDTSPHDLDGAQAVCVLDDGRGRWRSVTLPSAGEWRRWEPVSMSGTRLLLRASDDVPWTVFDTATGTALEVGFARGDVPQRVTSLAWVRGGALVGTGVACDEASCERRTPTLLVGDRPEALRDTVLPGDARRVAFVDARRGLAVGDTLGSVWRTVDGGRLWEEVPVDAAHEHDTVSEGQSVACDDGGCRVGRLLRIAGWGPMERSATRVVDVPGDVPEAHVARTALVTPQLPSLRCQPAAPVWQDAAHVASDAQRTGAFAHDDFLATLPPRTLPDGDTFTLRHALVDVAREGASTTALLPVTSTRGDFDILLDLDGASVRAQRRFVTRSAGASPGDLVALARHEGRWGRATVRATEPTRVIDADGREATLPPWDGALTLCDAAPAPDATTLRVPGCDARDACLSRRLFADARGDLAELAEVELGPHGACLRALHVRVVSSRDQQHVVHLRAQHGVLAGQVEGARPIALRCAPTPPSR